MSDHGANWYKREPAAYLGGVVGMTTRQHAVFGVILELIYMHGGSCPDDPKWIAGWFSDLGVAAVRNTISELAGMGKLTVDGDRLTNKRAKNEAKTREKLRENRGEIGKKGGVQSGFARRAAKENNDLSEPIGSPRLDKIREEEKREAKASPKKSPRSVLAPVLGEEMAAAVVEHRQRLRKPLTARAAQIMLREFEQCPDPPAGAEMMLARGWQGFKAEWFNRETTQQKERSDDRFARVIALAAGGGGCASGPEGLDSGEGAGSSAPRLPARSVRG